MVIQAESPPAAALPTLESGDRLSVAEFHRRYKARPDIKKAEIVAGIVYVASPVRFEHHARPHGLLVGILSAFDLGTPGVLHGDNATIRLGDDGEVQPDGLLRYTRRRGGRSHLDSDDYVVGPPALVAEIAASSVSYDLHDKKELYRRAGVQEYVVWRVEDEAIDWWQLQDGQYVPIPSGPDGVIQSVVFPGFSLDVPALLRACREAIQDERD